MKRTNLTFAVVLLWPQIAVAATNLESYTSGGNRFDEPGCRSLAFLSEDDKTFTLRVYGCEMTVAETLPPGHPGTAIMDDFKAHRLGTNERNKVGDSRTFVMFGGLLNAHVYDAAKIVSSGFECRDDGHLTFMTLEDRYNPDGSTDGMGVTVSQLVPDGSDWTQSYERSFNVAGTYRNAPIGADPSSAKCPSP